MPGFKEVQCDKPGSNEVKQRTLRKGDIRPLTDSIGPLLPMSYFHLSAQKCVSCEVGAGISCDISKCRNFGF